MDGPQRGPRRDVSATQVDGAAEGQHADDHRGRLEAALVACEIGTWTWDIRNDRVRGDINLDGMFGDPTEEVSTTSTPPKAPRRRVLVVDDNEDAANSLTMLLELDGHEAKAAYTAREALEQAASFDPDVVLLDIGLPEMDGYEVARRMRTLPYAGRMRLVALTGYGQAEDCQRALAAGFDDHLVKPVEFSALEGMLLQERE